jgi:hypothetical protein
VGLLTTQRPILAPSELAGAESIFDPPGFSRATGVNIARTTVPIMGARCRGGHQYDGARKNWDLHLGFLQMQMPTEHPTPALNGD